MGDVKCHELLKNQDLHVIDRGEWYLADEITCLTSPMLMVKPETGAGGSSVPCAFSSVPTDHVCAAIKRWKIESDALVWGNWGETGVELPIE